MMIESVRVSNTVQIQWRHRHIAEMRVHIHEGTHRPHCDIKDNERDGYYNESSREKIGAISRQVA